MKKLIELMEEYNLTLRRLPTKTTHTYDARHYRGLPNEEIYESVVAKISHEDFLKMRKQGCYLGQRWKNGFRIATWVRQTEEREGGWLVKIDRSYGSLQQWNRNRGDFFGKTPEEAIKKAIEHIKKERKQMDEWNRLAGLKD